MSSSKTSISRAGFGSVRGATADLYTLVNANGLRMSLSTYGGIVTMLEVPDREGRLADVVLGFESVDGYVTSSPYFGATVGRIGNRIRRGQFELDGRRYAVATNDGPDHLHGGVLGWDKVIWDAEAAETSDGPAVRISHLSPDGDEGYPGAVHASAVYTLTDRNELRIEMSATTDRPTLVNMLHHSYWNLGGVGTNGFRPMGPITDHLLTLPAQQYTPGDPQVPNGIVAPVAGTPFDFTQAKPVGRDLAAVGGAPVGYDHNFVVDGPNTALRPAARVAHPATGRVMTVEANQPGVQFYSGNYLDGKAVGKGGVAYQQYFGMCLETQAFPNAINVPAWRDQVLLKPGQTYKHTMIHKFTAE
jgi:aldose 1-epimerase